MRDTGILTHPIDKDNESLIIANAIQNPANREIFVRKADYTLFRLKEYQTLAWGILEVNKAGIEFNNDALLIKAQACPVRYTVDLPFIQNLLEKIAEVPVKNFIEHLEKLTVDSVKQKMIDYMTTTLLPACTNPTITLSDLDQRFIYGKTIIEKGYSSSKLGFKNMAEVAADFDIMKVTGISKRPTGFIQLDRHLTEGFKDGQITTIAALASAGKSSMCLSMMKNLSQLEQPTPVAQFALEMNNTSLFTKLLAFRTNLPISTIVKKPEDLSEDERKSYEWEKTQLAINKYIFLNDKPSQSIASIREQILLLQDHIKQQYMVVVIDLFGKLSDLQSSDNFARDYEQKLNQIQIMVRELGIHMILVAQLNREVGKKNRRPTMNDLKNSHALTEVSDIIMGIHRPYYDAEKTFKQHQTYGMVIEKEDDYEEIDDLIETDPNQNVAEVIILKQRMGPKDVLENFMFDPITTCFSPITAANQQQLAARRISEDDESA